MVPAWCLLAFVLPALVSCRPSDVGSSTDPEVNMDVIQIVRYWGYPCDPVTVTTLDGYKLTMHHIPHGKNQSVKAGDAPKPVIFLQHGLECSSSNWVTNLPWEAAGFMFADAGFDVWLGNFRGNTYSRGHTTLDPDKKPFWEFSYDDMASHDLPTMISYVLQVTGQKQLYYVGHSQGTMTVFAEGSRNATFAAQIKKFFALAPVARVGNIKGFLHYIAPFTNDLEFLLKLLGGWGEFLPSNELMKWLAKNLCGTAVVDILCDDILFLIAGADSKQLNKTRVPVYVSHTPAGTSTQNIVHFGQTRVPVYIAHTPGGTSAMNVAHFGQNVNEDKFMMYDYGSAIKNEDHYGDGVTVPPTYDLSTFKIPTYLFRGDMDILADPKDVDWLTSQLTTVQQVFRFADFNHLDFIWGLNAPGQIYRKIIDIVNADQ